MTCANIHKPSLQKFVIPFHSILCYPLVYSYVGEFVLIIMLVKIIKLLAMYNKKYLDICMHTYVLTVKLISIRYVL